MKIYTKTGDQGQTSLLGGQRVPKSHNRIEAYGTIDELNSFLGLLRDQEVNQQPARRAILKHIQDNLFVIGASLATQPEKTKVKKPDLEEADVLMLETEMDAMDAQLPALTNFILPGGHPSVSIAHIVRTICRRAERQAIRLNEESPVDELTIRYLNRLSDYLFVLGRLMCQELGADEVLWTPRKPNEKA